MKKFVLKSLGFTGLLATLACQNPGGPAGGTGGGGTPPTPTAIGGNAVWARSAVSGPSTSGFSKSVCDSSGNLYAVGTVSGTGTDEWGGGVVSSVTGGGTQALLIKYSSAGVAQWAQTVNGTSNSQFLAVGIDGSGNLLVLGTVAGVSTFDFGNSVTVTGPDTSADFLVAKYDPSGAAQWAHVVAGVSAGNTNALVVDASANVYATGFVKSAATANFGGGVTVTNASAGASNGLLVKYDASGTAQWVRTAAGSPASFLNGLATDDSGAIYCAASLEGTGSYSFGSNGLSSSGQSTSWNPVLVKYNSAGTAQWVQSATAIPFNSNCSFYTVATVAGHIVVGGVVSGTGSIAFGQAGTVSVVMPASGVDLLIVQYDASGHPLRASSLYSSAGFIAPNAMAVDSLGNIYTAGLLSGAGPYWFNASGSISLTAPDGVFCGFLAKFDSSGTAQWARMVSGALSSPLYGLTFSSGSLYVTGSITGAGTYTVDTAGTVTVAGSNTGSNALLVKYQ